MMRRSTVALVGCLLPALGGAVGPVFVHGCSKTTCTPVESTKYRGESTQTISITGISDSVECSAKCSTIQAGQHEMHVMGNWLDIRCRAWGGDFCVWDTRVLDRRKVLDALDARDIEKAAD